MKNMCLETPLNNSMKHERKLAVQQQKNITRDMKKERKEKGKKRKRSKTA